MGELPTTACVTINGEPSTVRSEACASYLSINTETRSFHRVSESPVILFLHMTDGVTKEKPFFSHTPLIIKSISTNQFNRMLSHWNIKQWRLV